jgi:hypothetical protein
MREVDLEGFLDGLTSSNRDIVLALRTVIGKVIPTAKESIVWGTISYHRPWVGGRVKGAVCQINTKHGEVRLDFIHGVRLSDPHGLLQGDGISKRFVPIQVPDEAEQSEIADLIREAAALDPTQWDESCA